MPIRPLLEGERAVFGAEDVRAIIAAFDQALERLGLVDRKDPIVLVVARTNNPARKRGRTRP